MKVTKFGGSSMADATQYRKVRDIVLSDPDRIAIEAYGVWQEKKTAGKVSMGVVRTTFLIDENGIITHVMPKVKPDTNAAEIAEMLGISE